MRRCRLLALVPLALLLGACGGGNNTEDTVRVEGTEYVYVTPSSIEGGVVSMEFANTGEEPHEFAMGRLQPGKTVADFRNELTSGGDEEPTSSRRRRSAASEPRRRGHDHSLAGARDVRARLLRPRPRRQAALPARNDRELQGRRRLRR